MRRCQTLEREGKMRCTFIRSVLSVLLLNREMKHIHFKHEQRTEEWQFMATN